MASKKTYNQYKAAVMSEFKLGKTVVEVSAIFPELPLEILEDWFNEVKRQPAQLSFFDETLSLQSTNTNNKKTKQATKEPEDINDHYRTLPLLELAEKVLREVVNPDRIGDPKLAAVRISAVDKMIKLAEYKNTLPPPKLDRDAVTDEILKEMTPQEKTDLFKSLLV